MKLPGVDRLGSLGFVGERKALALLCLGFYSTLFFLVGLSARTELPEWVPVFLGMMAIYVTAFVAVAAEWFWGRWFAVGLGYWGMTMTVMAFVSTRSLPPAMVIFGGMHALISLCLLGDKMAAAFDAKPGWRERWKLDEQGVIRVKKSVTRAASSLPALVMFALAPRGDQGMLASHTAALTLAAFALFGFSGFLLQRTWGVLVMAASGVACMIGALGVTTPELSLTSAELFDGPFLAGMRPFILTPAWVVALGGAMLVAAAIPFLRPMTKYLRA
jgi:hypothetical protein